MKVYFFGRGTRVEPIRDALGGGRIETLASAEDLASSPFEPGDLIIVSEDNEPALRAALDRLSLAKPAATVSVFTSLHTRSLARQYPDFFFRDDRHLYRNELRDLRRRTADRPKVEAVRQIARGAPLLTIIWGNPDPDAIAGAYALQDLLSGEAVTPLIAYTGQFTRPENAAMVNVLRIAMRKFTPDLATPKTVVATVDAQPSFFQREGPPRFDIVIDHHPSTDLRGCRFADVRPTYGSTSTILTEYYQAAGASMSRGIATALFYGLRIDTGNLTRNVNDADVAAFRHLRPRAGENRMRTIELSQLPVETLDYLALAIARKRIVRDLAFAWLGTIPNPDMCVHAADFFIKLTGIAWTVVACRSGDRVVAVFRSDGLRRHAGRLAEAAFKDFGTAGGHRTMARAEMDLARLSGELPDPNDAALEEWLLHRLGAKLPPRAAAP